MYRYEVDLPTLISGYPQISPTARSIIFAYNCRTFQHIRCVAHEEISTSDSFQGHTMNLNIKGDSRNIGGGH